ncbi:MAG: DoxX family membrane protein [Candidatus Paceibacterota bacterium]
MAYAIYKNNPFAEFLFANTKMAGFWLVVRLYLGWQWTAAGWGKVTSESWTGAEAGSSVAGFVSGALEKTSGSHPDVAGWYAWFLENVVLPNAEVWGYMIAYGELLVGIALIIGLLTGIAAFFGLFMNLNFMLAGTVSSNPVLFTLAIGLVLAWKVAGHWGVDRWLLPKLGTPWQPGDVFKRS